MEHKYIVKRINGHGEEGINRVSYKWMKVKDGFHPDRKYAYPFTKRTAIKNVNRLNREAQEWHRDWLKYEIEEV